MKNKIQLYLATVATLAALVGHGSSTTEHVDVPTTTEPCYGEWISSFPVATNLSATAGRPLVLVWSGEGCSYCNALKKTFLTESFRLWQKKTGFVYCLVQGDAQGYDTAKNTGAKKYTSDPKYGTASDEGWPYVSVSYGNDVRQNFCGRFGTMLDKMGATLVDRFTNSVMMVVGDYGKGSEFVCGETAGDRLEAQVGETMFVDVPVSRGEGVETNLVDTFSATLADETIFSTNLVWTADETEKFVRVAIPENVQVGDVIALSLVSGDSTATSSITVVERESSPKNPQWIGERDAATLAAGEWTMDVDLALSRAAAAKSVSLTMVGGSLWCPDCVNADAYLVDTDAFKAWATSANVFCAALDVPSFPKGGQTCLLTYTPTSVNDRYVTATTPPQERVQSGAGYLSRKGVPQTSDDGACATAILARNLNLVTNSVANGGLCRPECLSDANTQTGLWKTGVPCFILRNAEGRIVGRLDQFSTTSPSNDTACAAYVQRLAELAGLADDPTEELNAHWSTATTADCELSIRGGTNTSTISAIDLVDYWRLTGRDRWTRTTFTVQGAASAASAAAGNDVRLSLWKVADGKETKLATQDGSLAAGVSLAAQEIASDAAVDYFIRLEALATSAAFALDRAGDSVAAYTLTATSADDAGALAFGKASATATEADAKKAGGTLRVYVPVVRTGGASGATNATVVVDAAASSAFADRYEVVADEVSWADGETGTKNVVVDVFDDGNADGAQTLTLRLGEATFALQIVDNDKMNVGKVSLADAVPAVAKKGTVIAEEGTTVRLGVARTDGASGDASCTVSATAGTLRVGGEDVAAPVVAWTSRSSGTQWVELALPTLEACPAGKVTVSLANVTGAKLVSSAKSLVIQLVGTDAPRFEVQEKSFDLVRYCAFSETIGILNLAEGGTVKVTKLSGSLPSGVSAKLSGGAFVVSGTPSAKNASYEAVYQVTQVVGRQTVQGQTIRLAFTVTDVSTLEAGTPGANPSVKTTQKVPDIPVIDETDETAQRLAGIVSGLTILPTGKCSAKYKCADGTISLSAKSWSAYDAKTGALTATLVASRTDHALEVTVAADGTVTVALTDPAFEGELVGEAPRAWSKTDPATDWVGYCTAAICDPAESDILAGGAVSLVLKMTASAAKTGTMNYSGTLPNGQTFSGSSVLVRDGIDAVLLPIYYRTTKDVFTALLRIEANGTAQAVTSETDVVPWWRHVETLESACYETTYKTSVGSWIDSSLSLLETLNPSLDAHALVAPGALDEGIGVNFAARSVSLVAAEAKGVSARLTYNRTTGLVTGSFKMLTEAGKTVTASYRAVALLDYGDGCPTCGEIPWAMGAFWYSDKMTGEVNGRTRTYTVKLGDELYIEAENSPSEEE